MMLEEPLRLHFNLLEGAKEPHKSMGDDAGFDLFCTEDFTIQPWESYVVGTGVRVQLPENTTGMVCSRSGLASKHNVIVLNAPGIIDVGYTGEIKVVLMNLSNQIFTRKAHSKIAQLLVVNLTPVYKTIVSSESFNINTSLYERQNSGFGSTGN